MFNHYMYAASTFNWYIVTIEQRDNEGLLEAIPYFRPHKRMRVAAGGNDTHSVESGVRHRYHESG